VSDALEGIWKEASVVRLSGCTGILLDGLKKKDEKHYGGCSGLNAN